MRNYLMEPEEKDRRLWAKVDVDYFDNPKIDDLSNPDVVAVGPPEDHVIEL